MHRRALNRFLLSAAAFAATSSLSRSALSSRDRFAVHEWGTFTTLQGSDGSVLEGLHHEEEALPSFVHTVTSLQSGSAFVPAPVPPPEPPSVLVRAVDAVVPVVPAPAPAVFSPRGCGKGLPCEEIRGVTTKMETPVLYFHTDRPRHVRVKVDFEKGVLSQFYPAATLEGYEPFARPVLDLRAIARTSLDWSLDLVPHGDAATPAFPEVAADDPWQLAREVKAAAVRTADRREGERYVFYRGLARLDLPLTIEAHGRGRVTVKNPGAHAVPASFLVEMTPDGGRFVELGALAAGSRTGSSWAGVARKPRAEVVEALRARVKDALIAEGLHEDESEAMVRTWSRAWFGSEGTRVIYLVPRALTDAVLPIAIDPAPDELVRVLVGRLELLTPEVEREAETALRDRMHSRDPRKVQSASARLARFGRFLEPVARRVYDKTTDERVRAAAVEAVRRGA